MTEESIGKSAAPWRSSAAVSTLVLGLLAAVTALLAGITAHDSLLKRTEELLEVTLLEGDRVFVEVLRAKHEVLGELGVAPDPVEVEAISDFDREAPLRASRDEAIERAASSASSHHLVFAAAAVLLSIAIAIVGVAVVLSSRWLWLWGVFAGGGLGALVLLVGVARLLLD